MALINALPVPIGNPWSATAPTTARELITTWNLDEQNALAAPPDPDLAWADVGTATSQGVGIVKYAHSFPSTLNFEKFKPGGARKYNTLDVISKAIQPNPYDLSFGIPMIWNEIGNGWQLMSPGPNNTLLDFVGVNGLGADYVVAGKAYKCQLIASLFYNSIYCTGSGVSLITPTQTTFAQPGCPDGIALFTDGTGAAGSLGDQHYANPTIASSGRFKNVWSAFGEFMANYGQSLVKMTIKPHATLPNKTSGARVTDTFGGTRMRDKFWRMMIQSLTLESVTAAGVHNASSGVVAAAGTTNPYAMAVTQGMSEENFLGTAFGPRRFWILPELDNHPIALANASADFWINVSAGKDRGTGRPRATWAKGAGNSKDFVPMFRFYGPGDPRAMSERLMRFEGDLDGAFEPGAPGEVDMFVSV